MKNQIVYVTKHEAKRIKKDAEQDSEVYFVEVDGAGIKTEEDYVRTMADAFAFPVVLPKMILGWYNDYFNDLMWIEQNEIVLLIHDYDLMLTNHPQIKMAILSNFEEVVLPWWEKDVVGHMVGGVPRKFTVYLESLQTKLPDV